MRTTALGGGASLQASLACSNLWGSGSRPAQGARRQLAGLSAGWLTLLHLPSSRRPHWAHLRGYTRHQRCLHPQGHQTHTRVSLPRRLATTSWSMWGA